MNKHSFPQRLAVGSVLALTAALNLPSAHAFGIDQRIPVDFAPDGLALLGRDLRCTAIHVTPSISISTKACVAHSGLQVYFPKNGLVRTGSEFVSGSEPTDSNELTNDVALILHRLPDPVHPHANITPATILSYKDESLVLSDGNDAGTVGTWLRLYGIIGRPGLKVEATVATSYFHPNAPAFQRTLVYRSVGKYRQLEPQRFSATAADRLFADAVQLDLYDAKGLYDKSVNSRFIMLAGLGSDRAEGIVTPVTDADAGAGIFVRHPSIPVYAPVGLITNQYSAINGPPTVQDQGPFPPSTVYAHPRLSHYWPLVFKTLMANGLRSEAISFGQKVLATGTWGSDDQKGKIGDIYIYNNPFSHDVEFFKLVSTGADQRYGFFPTDKKNNQHWQYLGTELPSYEQAINIVRQWGESDRHGTLGDTYVYANPYNRQTEYFRLIGLGTDSRYWYFPTNKTNNQYWEYLGTEAPGAASISTGR